MKKSSVGILLALLLLNMLILTLNIPSTRASGAVHIRPNGSIDPATAPIQRDGAVYTFTGDICDSLVVERNGIVVDGRGFAVQGTGSKTGVDLSHRSNVAIRNVEVTDFDVGISLLASSNCTLSDNLASSNKLSGINLASSNDNTLVNNTVSSSEVGIILHRCQDNLLTDNIAFNNSLGGTVLYYSNNNVLVCNNVFSNNYGSGTSFMRAGFFFFTSGNNIVTGNTADGNCYGFFLTFSNNNAFTSNIVLNNDREGIYVYYSSASNFTDNIVSSNECGVGLEYSSANSFFHNNFLDNAEQVRRLDSDSCNEWDDGYPSGGNYWSDYATRYPDAEELDDSGISDTPYVIDEDNQDNYPLMEMWTPSPPIPRSIDELKTEIERCWSEGEIINQGIVNSLVRKLNVAQKLVGKGKIAGAKSILEDDLIPQVQNLSGICIAVDAADILIQSAEYMLSNL